MKVVILCGGLGTRLREETEFIPKPMVEIGGGRPILWHIMKTYSHFGLNEFVLCLGYKGDHIRRYFLDYDLLNYDVTVNLQDKTIIRHDRLHDERDWKVTLAETGLNTMTGGRIQRALRYVDGDTFLATYGDAVADVDIPRLVAFHRSHGKLATVTAVVPPGRFGRLEIDDRTQLATGFVEKPNDDQGWINGGFFVFNRGIERYLDGDACVLEQDPLMRLAADGQLAVYRHRAFWQCMDTLRDVENLRGLYVRGEAPWLLWQQPADAQDVGLPALERRLPVGV